MSSMPAAADTVMQFLEAESLVPLAFVLLMIFLLLRRRPRRSGQAKGASSSDSSESQASSSGSGTARPQQLRRDLESLLVELEELARKINAQIDTRFAKMETVIRDADRRIATLERLSRQCEQGSASRREPPPAGDTHHQRIYEMADRGQSPVEIARELGRTPGEVELILNLRGKPETPPAKSGPKKRKPRRKKNASRGTKDG